MLRHKRFHPLARDRVPRPAPRTTNLQLRLTTEEIIRILPQPISLESTVGDEADAVLADFVVDENLPDMDEVAARIVLKGQVEGVLETLTPRERRVVELRFGLEGDKLYTLSEIGAELGVTRERIRQIETKALRKLRHPSRSKRLREFTD